MELFLQQKDKMKNTKFELLAPAGDFERLKTAIYFDKKQKEFANILII